MTPDIILTDFSAFAYERTSGPPASDGDMPEAIALTRDEVTTDNPKHQVDRQIEQSHIPPRRWGAHETCVLQDTSAGKTEQALRFVANSIIVYNYSTTMWFCIDRSIGLYIPPGLYGAILPVIPGIRRGTLECIAPPGITQGAAGGQFCFVTFEEDMMDYRAGVIL